MSNIGQPTSTGKRKASDQDPDPGTESDAILTSPPSPRRNRHRFRQPSAPVQGSGSHQPRRTMFQAAPAVDTSSPVPDIQINPRPERTELQLLMATDSMRSHDEDAMEHAGRRVRASSSVAARRIEEDQKKEEQIQNSLRASIQVWQACTNHLTTRTAPLHNETQNLLTELENVMGTLFKTVEVQYLRRQLETTAALYKQAQQQRVEAEEQCSALAKAHEVAASLSRIEIEQQKLRIGQLEENLSDAQNDARQKEDHLQLDLLSANDKLNESERQHVVCRNRIDELESTVDSMQLQQQQKKDETDQSAQENGRKIKRFQRMALRLAFTLSATRDKAQRSATTLAVYRKQSVIEVLELKRRQKRSKRLTKLSVTCLQFRYDDQKIRIHQLESEVSELRFTILETQEEHKAEKAVQLVERQERTRTSALRQFVLRSQLTKSNERYNALQNDLHRHQVCSTLLLLYGLKKNRILMRQKTDLGNQFSAFRQQAEEELHDADGIQAILMYENTVTARYGRSQLRDASTRLQQLSRQVSEQQTQAQSHDLALRKKDNTVSVLKNEITQVNIQVDSLRADKSALNKTVDDLRAELATSDLNLHNLQSRMSIVSDQNTELHDKTSTMQGTLIKLQQEVRESKTEISGWEQRYAKSEEDHSSASQALSTQLTAMTSTNGTQKAELQNLHDEVQVLQLRMLNAESLKLSQQGFIKKLITKQAVANNREESAYVSYRRAILIASVWKLAYRKTRNHATELSNQLDRTTTENGLLEQNLLSARDDVQNLQRRAQSTSASLERLRSVCQQVLLCSIVQILSLRQQVTQLKMRKVLLTAIFHRINKRKTSLAEELSREKNDRVQQSTTHEVENRTLRERHDADLAAMQHNLCITRWKMVIAKTQHQFRKVQLLTSASKLFLKHAQMQYGLGPAIMTPSMSQHLELGIVKQISPMQENQHVTIISGKDSNSTVCIATNLTTGSDLEIGLAQTERGFVLVLEDGMSWYEIDSTRYYMHKLKYHLHHTQIVLQLDAVGTRWISTMKRNSQTSV